jgi:nicotinamidase-related amidase
MPEATALLVMDYQQMVLDRAAAPSELVIRMASVCEAARRAGVVVIHATVEFRPGHPEVSPSNKTFSGIKKANLLVGGTPNAAIVDGLTPIDGDIVVTRHRTSAFNANDLDQLLRSSDVSSLVLAGVQTSGCVLSTVRAGADLDYRMTVLGDCCYDADEELQRVLLDKLLPRQATVVPAEEWIASLAR